MPIAAQDEQERFLEEALSMVKQHSHQMRRSFDKRKLMDGLKHAASMLGELRTSSLTPKAYYEVFMAISDEMQHVEMFLLEEFQNGRKVADLYELVQYAGNIIPRLYLLITVGVVYIKSKEDSRKNIMKDLVEMCRGVQHPLRGLFLRNYLIQTTRNLLPDTNDCEDPEIHGTVDDSIDFILSNFAEMNKLWVRMHYQGHTRDRQRTEQEREELRTLVSANFLRLSKLEGVTLEIYKEKILPSLFTQMINSRDALAQGYLMECIIQAFPDEFHIGTLHEFLEACTQLNENVKMKLIIVALINRMTQYATSDEGPGIPEDLKLFDIFSEQIGKLIDGRSAMPLHDVVGLQMALLNLALKCYSHRLDYIDTVLHSTSTTFQNFNVDKVAYKSEVSRELLKMLRAPVNYYNNLLTLLSFEHFAPLFNYLSYDAQKEISCFIITNALENNITMQDSEKIDSALKLLSVLVKEQPEDSDLEDHEFDADQSLVAKFIILFYSDIPDNQYLILTSARKHFGNGGIRKIKYTLPGLVFIALQLAQRYRDLQNEDPKWEKKCQKIFQFIHQTVSALSKAEYSELSLRLYLQAAIVCDDIQFENHETVTYEFMSQAMSLYEEEIKESKAQLNAITLFVATLEKLRHFTEENHEPLRTQSALAASRLFKKPDQCRALALSSQVFWSGKVAGGDDMLKNGKRVTECLKKSLRFASQCMDSGAQIQLFVEILNRYLYLYENGCSAISFDILNQVINKVNEELPNLEPGDEVEQIRQHFENSILHIKAMQDKVDYSGLTI